VKLDAVESAAKNSPSRENIYHEFSESIANVTATARFKGESNLHSKRAALDIVCTGPANDRAAGFPVADGGSKMPRRRRRRRSRAIITTRADDMVDKDGDVAIMDAETLNIKLLACKPN
jgi:hypothetical protein